MREWYVGMETWHPTGMPLNICARRVVIYSLHRRRHYSTRTIHSNMYIFIIFYSCSLMSIVACQSNSCEGLFRVTTRKIGRKWVLFIYKRLQIEWHTSRFKLRLRKLTFVPNMNEIGLKMQPLSCKYIKLHKKKLNEPQKRVLGVQLVFVFGRSLFGCYAC